jgi:hypothetical protein
MTLLLQKVVEPRVQVVDHPFEVALAEVELDEVARGLEQLLAPKIGDQAANQVIAGALILAVEASPTPNSMAKHEVAAPAEIFAVALEVAGRSVAAHLVVALSAEAERAASVLQIGAVAAQRTRNVGLDPRDSFRASDFSTPAN